MHMAGKRIRKRMEQMSGRLREHRGESLAETLVAVLIMSFGALMLAGMVQSSTRIVQTSDTGMGQIYDAENKATAFMDGDTDAIADADKQSGNLGIDGRNTIQYNRIGSNTNLKIQIYHDDYSNITVFRGGS